MSTSSDDSAAIYQGLKWLFSLLKNDGAPDSSAATPENDFAQAVKILHSRDLEKFERFPKYQDFQGISLKDYREQKARLGKQRDLHQESLNALNRLAELKTDLIVAYAKFELRAVPSLLKKQRKIALPEPTYDGTVISTTEGHIAEGFILIVPNRFRSKKVTVTYSCEKHKQHAAELKTLENVLSELSVNDRKALDDIIHSPYAHPLLFISHRWESVEHPDPDSTQLRKLQALKDCFIIYDYSSFPQAPLSPSEEVDLQQILANMEKIMQRVVVLDHGDYLGRGWCIYEYIAACLSGSIICDELNDPKFVSLRNWAITQQPAPFNLIKDGYEALQGNQIQEGILAAVNAILPSFRQSGFTVEADRKIVKELLVRLLKRRLPAKSSYDPYLGEPTRQSWSDAELEVAFEGEIKWEALETAQLGQFKLNVAKSISEAVRSGYKAEKQPPLLFTLQTLATPLGRLQNYMLDRED